LFDRALELEGLRQIVEQTDTAAYPGGLSPRPACPSAMKSARCRSLEPRLPLSNAYFRVLAFGAVPTSHPPRRLRPSGCPGLDDSPGMGLWKDADEPDWGNSHNAKNSTPQQVAHLARTLGELDPISRPPASQGSRGRSPALPAMRTGRQRRCAPRAPRRIQ
jgi:hypothetical protein